MQLGFVVFSLIPYIVAVHQHSVICCFSFIVVSPLSTSGQDLRCRTSCSFKCPIHVQTSQSTDSKSLFQLEIMNQDSMAAADSTPSTNTVCLEKALEGHDNIQIETSSQDPSISRWPIIHSSNTEKYRDFLQPWSNGGWLGGNKSRFHF